MYLQFLSSFISGFVSLAWMHLCAVFNFPQGLTTSLPLGAQTILVSKTSSLQGKFSAGLQRLYILSCNLCVSLSEQSLRLSILKLMGLSRLAQLQLIAFNLTFSKH